MRGKKKQRPKYGPCGPIFYTLLKISFNERKNVSCGSSGIVLQHWRKPEFWSNFGLIRCPKWSENMAPGPQVARTWKCLGTKFYGHMIKTFWKMAIIPQNPILSDVFFYYERFIENLNAKNLNLNPTGFGGYCGAHTCQISGRTEGAYLT